VSATQRVVRLHLPEATAFFNSLADEFLAREAHLRIDGRPTISILNLPDFATTYSVDGLTFLLRLLRHQIQERLRVDPFIIGLLPDGKDSSVEVCRQVPCDAVTGYGLLPDWMGPPVQSYGELIEQRVAEWYRIQRKLEVPFLPVVCVGWDASRRGEHIHDLRQVRSFPWRPIIVGTSPELFGTFLDHAITFMEKTDAQEQVVFIHAWNEWSEGSAVEPSEEFGTDYLAEISSRFGNNQAAVIEFQE
jgi:hypothetical protein